MLGIGVLLDIFCKKYRKLASGLFAYECMILFLDSCVCVDRGVYSAYLTFMSLLVYTIVLGCQFGMCIVVTTLCYFIIEFVLEPQVSGKDNAYLIYHKVLFQICQFVFCSLGLMAINWMFKLYRNMKTAQTA